MRQVTLGQIGMMQDKLVQAAMREIERASLDFLILDVAGSAGTGIQFPNGSSSIPAIHGSDASTGIYWGADGETNFVGDLKVGYSGDVTVSGLTTPPVLSCAGSGTAGCAGIVRYSTPGAGGAIMVQLSTRGASPTSYTACVSGDGMGQLLWGASDGTRYILGAVILAQVDGAVSTDNVLGRIIFATSPGGANVRTEAMRITSAQGVNIGPTYVSDPGSGNLNVQNFISSAGGFKRVSTQFDKTSDTALADVTGLSATLIAGKTYSFEAILFTSSNVAGGVKAAIAGTATATAIVYEAVVLNGAAVAAQTRATALGTAVGGVTAVTVALIRIVGLITVNVGGTLTVQFSQNASNGAASSVLVGSYFNILKLT